MPKMPRFRRDQNPRRPPRTGDKPASESENLQDFEDVTGEVAREDDTGSESDQGHAPESQHNDIREREDFEDLTGEVTREGDETR